MKRARPPSGSAIDRHFAERARARRLFDAVQRAVERVGPATVRVARSQVSFSRARAFAWAWCPDRWLRGADVAPLVLSFAWPRPLSSRRLKEVVPLPRGRFLHHLEVRRVRDIDADVVTWLRSAWTAAAPKEP